MLIQMISNQYLLVAFHIEQDTVEDNQVYEGNRLEYNRECDSRLDRLFFDLLAFTTAATSAPYLENTSNIKNAALDAKLCTGLMYLPRFN